MPWIELSLHAGEAEAQQWSDLLSQVGALAVTLSDAGDQPLFEPAPGETPLWMSTRVTGLFNADTDRHELLDRLRHTATAPLPEIHFRRVEDQDWERVWIDRFKPQRFGDRLWVCPSWCEPPVADAVNLRLDPGLAFGTGTHPTTALCLEWLESHAGAYTKLLDYGCGSGILAIAALKLGASRAWGVDIDVQALTASRANAEGNEVSARLQLDLPEATDCPGVDLVLANILAGPLVDLAPQLLAYLKPGGTLVLSGILAAQAGEVLQAYAAFLRMDPVVERDGWVRLNGRLE